MLLSTFPPTTYPIAPPDNLISDILTVISLLAIAVWLVMFIIKKWEIVQIVSFIVAYGALWANVYFGSGRTQGKNFAVISACLVGLTIIAVVTRLFPHIKQAFKSNRMLWVYSGITILLILIFLYHIFTEGLDFLV